MDLTIEHFQDAKSKMFYFTSDDTELIARKMELNDNVIPANNSVMASNLFLLGKFFENKEYIALSEQMIANVYDGMEHYGSGYSHWANAMLHFIQPFAEVAITGPGWKQNLMEIAASYLPNAVFAGGTKGQLPLLQDRISGENQVFICRSNMCLAPESNIEQVRGTLQNLRHDI